MLNTVRRGIYAMLWRGIGGWLVFTRAAVWQPKKPWSRDQPPSQRMNIEKKRKILYLTFSIVTFQKMKVIFYLSSLAGEWDCVKSIFWEAVALNRLHNFSLWSSIWFFIYYWNQNFWNNIYFKGRFSIFYTLLMIT